jgi:hypothetical protein
MQDAVDRQLVAVILVDGAGDFRFAGYQRLDCQIRVDQRAQLVQGDDVVRIGDGDGETLLALDITEGEQQVALGELARDQAQGFRVDDGIGEVDRPVAEGFAQGVAQRGFGEEAEGDQQFAHRLVGLHLLQQRNAQLILADHSLRDQDLANGSAAGWRIHTSIIIPHLPARASAAAWKTEGRCWQFRRQAQRPQIVLSARTRMARHSHVAGYPAQARCFRQRCRVWSRAVAWAGSKPDRRLCAAAIARL